jgi:hypothetical protein
VSAQKENGMFFSLVLAEDGKKMNLIWSDAGEGHDTNYKWNQMEIEILTE